MFPLPGSRLRCGYRLCESFSVCNHCGRCAIHCKHPEDPKAMGLMLATEIYKRRTNWAEAPVTDGQRRGSHKPEGWGQ